MKINLVLAGLAAAIGAVVVLSLRLGKTPYFGLFQRNFIARRKWEGAQYWSMIIQYVALCVLLAAAALFVPGHG